MPNSIPGLELLRLFHEEVVKPILDVHFAGLNYGAPRLGLCSEVLGFDTVQSINHEWGSRLRIFVARSDDEAYGTKISEALAQELPYEFHRYSANFGRPDEEGVHLMESITNGTTNHLFD